MVEFSVAAAGGSRAEFRFSVAGHMVLVAGSRHLEVDGRTCRDLLEGLHLAGFHFFVGCARGVDKSFRRALAQSPFREEGFVACAFQSRALHERSLGLYAQLVVPEGLAPAAALRRRTLWMVRRCALVVLIPVTRTGQQEHKYCIAARALSQEAYERRNRGHVRYEMDGQANKWR